MSFLLHLYIVFFFLFLKKQTNAILSLQRCWTQALIVRSTLTVILRLFLES